MRPKTVYTKYFAKISNTSTIVLLCIALIAITLAVYMQAGNHQFLNFDDEVYVTNNPHVESGLTGRNIVWAFTSVDEANWHPITWLSHMTDVQFFGMNPRGHHLTSVAIHTVSSLFLFLLLLRLTGALWQSLFVAALFALHPMHVESVAWVSERKDVLSALFWFLTLLLYAEYVAKQKPVLYILTLFSFVLGLMSKPMLVTLPTVMLLMDFWPLNRFQYVEQEQALRQITGRVMALVKEKIPFFFCSLFSALITIYAQHAGGAIAGLTRVSFRLRIENALIAYARYIGKTLWPHDLAVYYPLPSYNPLWQVIGSLFILFLLSAAAIRDRYRHPFLAAGWLWFLITLLPVIGFIQVGNQSMADRYSYIPLTGLFIMIAWGVPELAKELRHRQGILALLSGVVIFTSTALTWQQLGYWRDNISLYRHTLGVTSGNYLIHDNLGSALAGKGELDAAIREYQEAIRLNPSYKMAHYNLGVALDSRGDLDAAIQEFRLVLRIDPNYTDAINNMGVALATKGHLNAAIQEFQRSILINYNNTDTHNNMGQALVRKGCLDAAIREYQEALRITPNNGKAHNNLESALAQKRMLDQSRR